jgi:hypothetical protein
MAFAPAGMWQDAPRSSGRGMTPVADGHLDRLIASLDARFGAAVAQAREQAADELALSLSHSASFLEAASRLGPLELVLEGGGHAEVTCVGADYVASGDPTRLLVPSSRALVRQAGTRAPDVREAETLAIVLLRWVRAGAEVELVGVDGAITGRLNTAGRDHVGLDARGQRWLLGRDAIRSVRRLGGG